MRNLMIVAGLLVGIGGCGSKDKFDEVLGEMSTFKDKMCACTDKSCADKVQDDWKVYRKGMKEKVGKDAKPNEAQDKKGHELDEAMRTCRHKYDAAEGLPGAGGAPGAGTPVTPGAPGQPVPAPAPTTP